MRRPAWLNNRSNYFPGWVINVYMHYPIALPFVATLELTLQIRSKIFSYENRPNWARLLSKLTQLKCLLTEAWGRSTEPLHGEHGLSHYSQGLTEKFCQGVPLRRTKITIVFHRKWMLRMMNDHAVIITTTKLSSWAYTGKIIRRPLNPNRCAFWTPFRRPWLQLHRYAMCTTVTKLVVLKIWYG